MLGTASSCCPFQGGQIEEATGNSKHAKEEQERKVPRLLVVCLSAPWCALIIPVISNLAPPSPPEACPDPPICKVLMMCYSCQTGYAEGRQLLQVAAKALNAPGGGGGRHLGMRADTSARRACCACLPVR